MLLDRICNTVKYYNITIITEKDILSTGTWRKGTDHAGEIRRQIDICCGLGLSEEANTLYEKYQKYT